MNILYRVFAGPAFIAAISLSGCAADRQAALKEHRETRPFFGTYISIQCFYKDGLDIEGARRRCWEVFRDVEDTMSARSQTGCVARINESGPGGVSVSGPVYALLKESIELSRLTGGAFDVTVMPLVELWNVSAQEDCMPDADAIEDARSKVDYKNIEFAENNVVYLNKRGAEIDLGGIAKGYAVDKAAGILAECGIDHFLIDAGGDIYCRGMHMGKEAWRVGIRGPRDAHRIVGVLALTDAAVTTSGDYERFYTIGGRRFSHIIDPATGYPQEVVISATVVAPTALQADALSTALCVMGAERGLALVNSLEGVDALIIEERGGIVTTHQSRYNFIDFKI